MILLQAHSYSAIEAKDGEKCAIQFIDAIDENLRPEHKDKLMPIVAAIRYAENGGPGREYGIIHKRAKTYRDQAGWCAKTVQNDYDEWLKSDRKMEFLKYLATQYAPIGVDNDPNGLNKHWYKNVLHWQKRIIKGVFKELGI